MTPPLLSIIAAAVAGLTCVDWVLRWRKSRKQYSGDPHTAPDWNTISSYMDLASAAGEAHWLEPDDFLNGPFRRFLEIASSPADPPRARARMMEFCRSVAQRYGHRQAERGADPAEFETRARAMAAEWFGRPDVPNGDYMLEVFDGISNHNWRGKREP